MKAIASAATDTFKVERIKNVGYIVHGNTIGQTHRVEYLVTNQISVETTEDAKKVGGFRWKIEQFHREVKQLTGAAKCQARKGRKQRNHICIAFVVWHQLHELADQMKTTMYEVKHVLLRAYQKQLWRNPAYRFDSEFLGEFA